MNANFESVEQAKANDNKEDYIDFSPVKPDADGMSIPVKIKAVPSLRVFTEYYQASKYTTVALHHLELSLPEIDKRLHVFDDDFKQSSPENILTIIPHHDYVRPLTAQQVYYDSDLRGYPSIQMSLLRGLKEGNGIEMAQCSIQSLSIYLTITDDTGACYTMNAMNKLAEIDSKQYWVTTKHPFHKVDGKGDSGCVANPTLIKMHVNHELLEGN